MPFQKGFDPHRFDLRSRKMSQNPSTAGAEIVRMDPTALTSRLDQIKNPQAPASFSAFGGTGGWGGNQGDTWGTFKIVSPAGRDEWTKSAQVVRKADDPW